MQCAVPNITDGLASEVSDICPLKQYYRQKKHGERCGNSPVTERMQRTIASRLHVAYSGGDLLDRLRAPAGLLRTTRALSAWSVGWASLNAD